MSEHKWEFGDWAETPSGKTRLRVIHVGGRHIKCIDARGLTYGESLPPNLTHLPDCDSFDWQPPPPPLELREGAWYERRDGKVVGPCEARDSNLYPWGIDGDTYMSDGSYHVDKQKRDHDLIREVPARPFASAEEYKPHRDRWVRHKTTGNVGRIATYSDVAITSADNCTSRTYNRAFSELVFDDDGSPFGVQQ